MTKIILDGKEYELDVNKAKKDGYLKEIIKPIKTLAAGDVLYSPVRARLLAVQTPNGKWIFAGCIGLQTYGDDECNGLSHHEALEWLNKRGYIKAGNINNQINNLLIDLVDSLVDSK